MLGLSVLGYRPFSEPGLFLWKKALKHSKEYFVSGCLKQDTVPGNRVFHTLDLEKAFSFRGRSPLTPMGALPLDHTGSRRMPLAPHFQVF